MSLTSVAAVYVNDVEVEASNTRFPSLPKSWNVEPPCPSSTPPTPVEVEP